MNDLYEDNMPLQNCMFPKRGILNESDLHLPRWIGACCDMTAIIMRSHRNINKIFQIQTETAPKSKKDKNVS